MESVTTAEQIAAVRESAWRSIKPKRPTAAELAEFDAAAAAVQAQLAAIGMTENEFMGEFERSRAAERAARRT